MADIQETNDKVTNSVLDNIVADFTHDATSVVRDMPGFDSLTMEPNSITTWLERFGDNLVAITDKRHDLAIAATGAATVSLGEFPPSLQIRAKMADRMGTSEGGLAWALKSVVLRLTDIHEALRQSLAAHLDTDLDNMKIIDKVHDALA